MIRVVKQPEPHPPAFDFDERVRQPGRSALAELTGQPATLRRPGPKISKVAERVEDIPGEVIRRYDYWTKALDALHEAYKGICSYACLYIEPVTGPTVDHFVAIHGNHPHDAYEWDNYRLACSLLNARKRDFSDVLDPCLIEDGWFVLNLGTYEVEPAAGLPETIRAGVVATAKRLGLNSKELREHRRRYLRKYWHPDVPSKPVPLWSLERDSPFLVREMRRQGRIRPEDMTPNSGE